MTCLGHKEATVNNILTLKECSPIIGAEVMSFRDEKDLLLKWQRLLRTTDPDIIIGYNISNFDLPYLVNRARKLKIEGDFEFWGRIRSSRLKMRDSQFSSKAYGTHEYKEITVEGRVQFDLMLSIQRDHKLSSYSLNSVSAHFLDEQKEDVHHSIITDLQNGNPDSRRRLAVYCIKVRCDMHGWGDDGGLGCLPPSETDRSTDVHVQLHGDGQSYRGALQLPPHQVPTQTQSCSCIL